MARLVLHQPDARSAARLSSALAGAHDVAAEPSWQELQGALADPEVEGCLLDADHPTPREAAANVRFLQDLHRDLALVGFTDRDSATHYFRLGALGLDAVVSTDDGPMTTRMAVEGALALARGRRVRRALTGVLPDPAPELLGWSLANAGTGLTVEALADHAGTSPRSLRHELDTRGLGTPSDLLLWGRLLLAGWKLSRDGRRVEETAFVLGYAGASSLGRALRRKVGITLREAAAPDGLERVAAAVLERLGLDPDGIVTVTDALRTRGT